MACHPLSFACERTPFKLFEKFIFLQKIGFIKGLDAEFMRVVDRFAPLDSFLQGNKDLN